MIRKIYADVIKKCGQIYRWTINLLGGQKNKEKIDYLIFGVLTTIVGNAVYLAFTLSLKFERAYLLANAISWIAAVAFAYVTNRKFVFKSTTTERKELIREIGSFVASRFFTLLVDYAWMILAVEALRMNDYVAKWISYVIVVVLNYILSKLFIFRQKTNAGGGSGKGAAASANAADNEEADNEDADAATIGDDGAGMGTWTHINIRAEARKDVRIVNADAAEADVANANITGADTAETDVTEADIADADVADADVTEADIAETYVAEAYVAEAYVTKANVTEADTVEAVIAEAVIAEADAAQIVTRAYAPRWISKYGYALLSFFAPVALLTIAFACIGVSPFGDNTILIIDNHHQYTPFLIEFGEMLRAGKSMLYSWTAGLGSNYLARISYYLASPLNFLAVFIGDRQATDFVLALVLFRAGAAGLATFIYLREKFRAQSFITVAFGVMYALCGYFLAYYWNIMWFDCIALFPIVALGIERLAKRGAGLMYCLALAYSIMSNYFIAIMICIYSLLYFIANLAAIASVKKTGKLALMKKTGLFAFFSLTAGALSAVITLPAYFGLLRSSAAGAKLPKDMRFYSDTIDIIANHLALIKPSIMVGLPNIYCGVAVLILVPLYYLNRKISMREKISYGLLACFFIISFNINTLDFLWHGTHFPNSLFFRFAFLYVFLILTMSYHALIHIGETDSREAFAVFALLTGFIFFMESKPAEKTTKWTVYGSFVFAVAVTVALVMLIRASKRGAGNANGAGYAGAAGSIGDGSGYADDAGDADSTGYAGEAARKKAVLAFAALLCVEVTINAGYGIGEAGVFTKQNYFMKTDTIKPTVDRVNAMEKASGDGFERMEFTTHTTYNTPVIYGYKGISYYSSTSYVAVNDMFGKLGLIHSNAWYVYRSAPPTLNSMFAVKYLLSQDGAFFNGIYPEVTSKLVTDGPNNQGGPEAAVRVYENPYFLPIGFMVDGAVTSWNLTQTNPFLCQEDFYKRAAGGLKAPIFNRLNARAESLDNMSITSGGGTDGVYRYSPVEASRDIGAKYRVTADRDGPVYFFVKGAKIDTVKVTNYSGREPVVKEHKINYPYILDAQYVRAGDEAEVELVFESPGADSFTLMAYDFNEDSFFEAWKRLSNQPFHVTEYSDTKLSGVIDVKKTGLMYTSIPYDDGWKIEIDGAPARPGDVATVADGALTALWLDSGRHYVTFSYMTPGLIPGALVTSAAALALVCAVCLPRFLKRRRRSRAIDDYNFHI